MKNSLKSLVLLFFLLLLVQFVFSEEKKPFKPRFSLKLTAGLGSALPIGDVNDCLESFNNNEVFEAHREYETGQVVGEIKTLDTRIFHGEAELRFDLTPRISFGIATSPPIHKRNESSVTYTILGWAGPQVMTWTFRPEIKVSYPIRLSAYYTLPLIRRLSISIGGGVGFCSAKIEQFGRYYAIYPLGDTGWVNASQVAKRNFALGFHGGVAFEKYIFTNRLSLIAEFQARYINIRGLKGTHKKTNEAGNHFETRGTLYYFTWWDHLIGARYASIEVHESPPDAGCRYTADIRKAVLNLSGYSFRIGIRIRLF